jgi:hypothetical protein
MNTTEKVKEIYNKVYGNTPTRMDVRLIESDKSSAKLNTILVIETVIDAIKHEDNKMYYEIEYWKNCLTVANAL